MANAEWRYLQPEKLTIDPNSHLAEEEWKFWLKTFTNFVEALPRAGWSNFSTLVGHFSKLFEFAGLSRLKIPIFVPKLGCSLKKKKKRSSLGIGL